MPTAARRAQLELAVAELRASGRVPGLSAAFLLPSDELLLLTDGWADREAVEPMTAAHRMLSGSTGKTYVTALAHLLARDGSLDLDARPWDLLGEPDWLAAIPNGREVTLHQLLRHESGLPRYVFAPDFWEVVLGDPNRVWDPRDQLAYVAGAEPLFAPGEGWAYSDTNFLVVGLSLEAVGGAPIDEQIAERILAPYDFRDTLPSDSRDLPFMAQGHAPASAQLGVPAKVIGADGRFVFNPQFEGCGGGYANTPADLARWAKLLTSGELLGPELTARLLDGVPAPSLGPDRAYGSGVMITATRLGPLLGHEGFMPGYVTAMGWFPELDLAGAFQINTDDASALGMRPHEALVLLAEAVLAVDDPEAR